MSILWSWDRWPRVLRHGAILVLCALLDWAARDGLPSVGPWLAAHEPLGPLVGAAAAQLLLVVLPLVKYADPGPTPPPDAGWSRAVLLIGGSVVLLVAASAAPALAARPGGAWFALDVSSSRARPVVLSLRVPEVLTAIGGCAGDARTYLTVRELVGDRSGSWSVAPDHAGVVVEGWFEGGWRRPTQAPTPDGGILADAGWGRWRARLGSTTGPALDLAGDTCGVFGDAPKTTKAA